jgi:hypothetical protein
MEEMINHPIVVIAVLGGMAVFLREIFWFVKSMTNKTPSHDTNRALDKVVDSLHELNANVKLQIELGKTHHQAIQEQNKSVIRHIDELKQEVKR